ITGNVQRIMRFREEINWSPAYLAQLIDINKSVMNRIESEERPIRDCELDKIASVLDTSSDYLVSRELSEQTPIYYSPKMRNEVIDTLGISELPFKDISKLNYINDNDRKEVIDFIQYIIHRAVERGNE